MRLLVVGAGPVGLVAAAGFARDGHQAGPPVVFDGRNCLPDTLTSLGLRHLWVGRPEPLPGPPALSPSAPRVEAPSLAEHDSLVSGAVPVSGASGGDQT